MAGISRGTNHARTGNEASIWSGEVDESANPDHLLCEGTSHYKFHYKQNKIAGPSKLTKPMPAIVTKRTQQKQQSRGGEFKAARCPSPGDASA
jgi:hypothetical protein